MWEKRPWGLRSREEESWIYRWDTHSICRTQWNPQACVPSAVQSACTLTDSLCEQRVPHCLSFVKGVKILVSPRYLRIAEACPRLSKIHRYFLAIRMQQRANISNTPEVFFIHCIFLLKNHWRYTISIPTDCSTLTKPASLFRYLATCVHVMQLGMGGK